MDRRSAAIAVAGVAGLLFASAVHAVDGVIEINQAKVMAAGGFPFNITAGGSYRLTSNLVVADGGQANPENLFGIQVGVSSEPTTVDLDLNGFAIVGPVTCTSPPLDCSSNESGSGVGVFSQGGPLRLHDGTIQGFAGNGVVTGGNSLLRNLDVHWNFNGIVSGLAVLENIIATENRAQGVSVTRAVLSRIFAQRNGDDGITMFNSTLDSCVSMDNAKDGVQADEDTVVSNCVILDNDEYGLRGSSNGECGYRGNTLADNTAGNVIDCVQTGANVCVGVLCTP